MKWFKLLGLCLLSLTAACSKHSPEQEGRNLSKPAVYTVNYPLQFFAQEIGGDFITVVFPAIDGDPAFWEPSPEEVGGFQSADLILLNGANYAKWVNRVSLPSSRLVDTSASFSDQFIPLNDQVSHSHGPQGEHEHGDVTFTTWLDPVLAIAQAQAIRDALIGLLPEEEEALNRRFQTLANELNDLDRQLAAVTKKGSSVPLIFSHPVYQYLERRYNLDGISVHWEPEEEPSFEQWTEFAQLTSGHPAQWMVWEGEPNPVTVEKLDQAGVKSLIFDPCGNAPESGDYLSVMQQNALELNRAFRNQRME